MYTVVTKQLARTNIGISLASYFTWKRWWCREGRPCSPVSASECLSHGHQWSVCTCTCRDYGKESVESEFIRAPLMSCWLSRLSFFWTQLGVPPGQVQERDTDLETVSMWLMSSFPVQPPMAFWMKTRLEKLIVSFPLGRSTLRASLRSATGLGWDGRYLVGKAPHPHYQGVGRPERCLCSSLELAIRSGQGSDGAMSATRSRLPF